MVRFFVVVFVYGCWTAWEYPDYVFLGGRPSLGFKSELALLDEVFLEVVDLVAMVGFVADVEDEAVALVADVDFVTDVDIVADVDLVAVGYNILVAWDGPDVGGNILLALEDELALCGCCVGCCAGGDESGVVVSLAAVFAAAFASLEAPEPKADSFVDSFEARVLAALKSGEA